MPQARRQFAASRPQLTALQQRLLDELEATGLATVPLAELLAAANHPLAKTLQNTATQFSQGPHVRAAAQQLQAGSPRATSKQYLVKYYDHHEPHADDPLEQFSEIPEIRDIVDAYLGVTAQCIDANIWYTIPSPSGAPRTKSQNWHRDWEDRRLVKLFLFFHAVDEDAGPFEYIPSSRPGQPHGNLAAPAWGVGGRGHYPTDEQIEQRIPDDQRLTCCVPAGTLVFCDTSGLHRGGYAQGRDRLQGTWTFVSPATLATPRLAHLNGRVATTERSGG